MFALKVANPQTKTAESPTSKLAPQRSVFASRPFGGQRPQSIGDQATIRLLSQRNLSPTGIEHGNEHEREAMTGGKTSRGVSGDFSTIPILPPERANRLDVRSSLSAPRFPGIIQPKLVVGDVNDPLEREADRVADHVMRLPAGALSIAPGPPQLSRKCAVCEEEAQEPTPMQRKTAGGSGMVAEVPASVHNVLRTPGTPLDTADRAFLEPRFNRDFGKVRVHADEPAARSAAAVGAAAYTVGPHIAFAAGRYAPATDSGRQLLAHELAHVIQQQHAVDPPLRRQPESAPAAPPAAAPAPAACKTRYAKATSFQDLINLVRAAETALSAAGITTPKDQIHAIRGIYYGTLWSLDYSVEKSPTRNEGFQRFTRPSQDPAKSVPPDIRTALDCGLFDALRDSQDLVDPSGRQVDFGHLIIGLDARADPAFASNVKYPVKALVTSIDIDLGGTGTELVTWLGDLGGGAASLASKRVAVPATSASTVFTGSDYGGSINLEGDVAGSVVATGGTSAVTQPNIPAGKRLSDVLQDYLSPAAPSAGWKDRATSFLTMNGGTFDASGALTNRAALIAKFAPKIQDFACNYLASRVKDKHITLAVAKAAADHVIPASQEVAAAFVDALDDSHKSGGKIEAKRFPSPMAAKSGACSVQINLAGAAAAVGL
jgi:hypothetical protein